MTLFDGVVMIKYVPHFFIIGACKAGTTTLYDDLACHPNAAMPQVKEPDILHRCNNASHAFELWARHYRGSKPSSIRGEGSTYYTMTPQFSDVSQLAREIVGPDARIVYIMRDPIARIQSHLAHDYAVRNLSEKDLNKLVLMDPKYVDWSDYPKQIKPWISAFGRDNIKTVIFEQFIKNRLEIVRQVAQFIGLEPLELQERETVSNRRGSQRVARSALLGSMINSKAYQFYIRESIPNNLHRFARNILTRRKNLIDVDLVPKTVDELSDRLAHVVPELRKLKIEPGDW